MFFHMSADFHRFSQISANFFAHLSQSSQISNYFLQMFAEFVKLILQFFRLVLLNFTQITDLLQRFLTEMLSLERCESVQIL